MRKLAFATVALLVLACASRASVVVNDWFRDAPDALSAQLSVLDSRDFQPVAKEKLDAARKMLETASVVPLAPLDAQDLVDRQLGAGSFFLIRGLCLGCGSGTFGVYTDGTNLLVDHASLAGRKVKPTRWPVLVKLDRMPSEVYVECHAAR